MEYSHQGHGKIARCPLRIREELNQRMLDGQLGPDILPWINGLPEVQAILAKHFDGEPISPKNLSDYRTGPWGRWLARRGQIDRQRQLSEHAMEVVKASGMNLTGAAAALAAGRLYEAMERISDEDAPPAEIVKAIADLRSLDLKERGLEQRDKELGRRDRELSLRELAFYLQTARRVAELAQSAEVQRIASGPGNEEEKMRALAGLIFGEDLIAERERRAKEARGE